MQMYKAFISICAFGFLNKCFAESFQKSTTQLCYEECSPNEVFVECNASCEPNCGASFNNNSSNLNCGCVHGCVCKPGMIRSSKTGKCVSMTKCLRILAESNATSSCGTNEHYTEENSVCQASCFTINESKDCFPVSGCICNDGFVRDVRNGECIRIEKCPKCRPGEDWIPCSNCTTFECQNTCGTCVCRQGYIAFKGHCIRNCAHRECSDKEEHLSCSNCENCCFNNPRTTCDKDGCYEGCYCKKDLVRDPLLGICVPFDQCPTHCPRHERFDCKVKQCERTCDNIDEPCEAFDAPCENSCYCKNGFVKSSAVNGTCVHFTDCPKLVI